MNTNQKEEYETPAVLIYHFRPESFICTSPGAGGSEGTGDEPLFAPNPLFDDGFDIGLLF